MTRILQISDPHIVSPPYLVSGKIDTFECLKSTVDAIASDRAKFDPIDAVVVTGDVSDSGEPESYRLFREQIERLDVPYFLIPGNHDDRENLRQNFLDANFMPAHGRINWRKDFGDFCVVGLDTLVQGESHGIFDRETADFLAETIATFSNKPLLVAMHHPPFSSGVEFMDSIGLRGVDLFEEVLETAGHETRILCGHLHNLVVGAVRRNIAIVCPSIASTIAPDFRTSAPVGFFTDTGGYMIHDYLDGFRSTSISSRSRSAPYPF